MSMGRRLAEVRLRAAAAAGYSIARDSRTNVVIGKIATGEDHTKLLDELEKSPRELDRRAYWISVALTALLDSNAYVIGIRDPSGRTRVGVAPPKPMLQKLGGIEQSWLLIYDPSRDDWRIARGEHNTTPDLPTLPSVMPGTYNQLATWIPDAVDALHMACRNVPSFKKLIKDYTENVSAPTWDRKDKRGGTLPFESDQTGWESPGLSVEKHEPAKPTSPDELNMPDGEASDEEIAAWLERSDNWKQLMPLIARVLKINEAQARLNAIIVEETGALTRTEQQQQPQKQEPEQEAAEPTMPSAPDASEKPNRTTTTDPDAGLPAGAPKLKYIQDAINNYITQGYGPRDFDAGSMHSDLSKLRQFLKAYQPDDKERA